MNGKESDWSRGTFTTAMIAAVFGALYLVNDTYIMHRVITSADHFTAVSVYLVFGGWIGTICTLVYNAILGKRLVPEYPGFNFGTRRMQLFALVSGAIAAGSTTFCLMGNQSLDPSLVTALANLSLLYLVVYDGATGKVSLAKIWLPVLLVLAGSVLTSVTKLSGGIEFTLLGILILLLGRCGTDAVEKIVRQRGVWKSDPATFNFWRFLWLTVVGTILVIAIAVARGTTWELWSVLGAVWRPALPWVLLTMFLVFFFNTLFQKALKSGAVSKVTLVINLQIVLGIPLTLLADRFQPGVFGVIPTDPLVWGLRLVGAALIVAGVVRLRNEHEGRQTVAVVAKKVIAR